VTGPCDAIHIKKKKKSPPKIHLQGQSEGSSRLRQGAPTMIKGFQKHRPCVADQGEGTDKNPGKGVHPRNLSRTLRNIVGKPRNAKRLKPQRRAKKSERIYTKRSLSPAKILWGMPKLKRGNRHGVALFIGALEEIPGGHKTIILAQKPPTPPTPPKPPP